MEEEKKDDSQKFKFKPLLQVLAGVLIVFVWIYSPVLQKCWTSPKPKSILVDRDSLKRQTIVATDQVNIYRSLNFIDEKPAIISFNLMGIADSRQICSYALNVYLQNRHTGVMQILENDSLLMMLSDSTIVRLNAGSNGKIHTSRGGRRRLPLSEENVYYELTESLLDSICNNSITNVSIYGGNDTCTVWARNGVTEKLKKRKDFLTEFLHSEGEKWEVDELIESTKTNDHNMVRFAKMKSIHLDDGAKLTLKGYIDKDGKEGYIWNLYIHREGKALPVERVKNNMTIRMFNGKATKTYAYSDGLIRRSKYSGERVQLLICNISPRTMEAICNNGLTGLEIRTKNEPYMIYAYKNVPYELQRTYKVLKNYLHSDTHE